MILTTYDKDLYEKTLKEDAREEGFKEGFKEGLDEARAVNQSRIKPINQISPKSQTLQRPRTRYRRYRISKETIKRIWHRIKTK